MNHHEEEQIPRDQLDQDTGTLDPNCEDAPPLLLDTLDPNYEYAMIEMKTIPNHSHHLLLMYERKNTAPRMMITDSTPTDEKRDSWLKVRDRKPKETPSSDTPCLT